MELLGAAGIGVVLTLFIWWRAEAGHRRGEQSLRAGDQQRLDQQRWSDRRCESYLAFIAACRAARGHEQRVQDLRAVVRANPEVVEDKQREAVRQDELSHRRRAIDAATSQMAKEMEVIAMLASGDVRREASKLRAAVRDVVAWDDQSRSGPPDGTEQERPLAFDRAIAEFRRVARLDLGVRDEGVAGEIRELPILDITDPDSAAETAEQQVRRRRAEDWAPSTPQRDQSGA